jgi:hypothetical protein
LDVPGDNETRESPEHAQRAHRDLRDAGIFEKRGAVALRRASAKGRDGSVCPLVLPGNRDVPAKALPVRNGPRHASRGLGPGVAPSSGVSRTWKTILVITATIAVAVVVGVATGGLGDAAALAILGADASPLAAGAISGSVVGALSGAATSFTYQTGDDLANGKKPGLDVVEATGIGLGVGAVTGPLIPAATRLFGAPAVATEEAAQGGARRVIATVVTQLPYRQGFIVAFEKLEEKTGAEDHASSTKD